MPSSVTHGYFAVDVYKKIKNKKNIDLDRLKTFSQGPDIFFFYQSINRRKSKEIRKFGKYIQKNNTQMFFYNLIKYIKDNKLENNTDVITYLYGFILHYSLDSTIHPYVVYKSGIYNKSNKETIKYKHKHEEIEKYLDNYMINKKETIKSQKFKIHKFLFKTNKFDSKLKDAIEYTFYNTYKINNVSKYYYVGLRVMSLSYYLLRYDPFKIKKYIYKLFKALRFLPINVDMLSYANEYMNKEHYLNNEKKVWNHPCIKTEEYSYSFDELYEIAIEMAINLIEETNTILYGKNDVEYSKKIFNNISYVTGKDCNLKLQNKYFEF